MTRKSKKIDLHGYSLAEAEYYLIDEILANEQLGYNSLRIIHGYNRGTAIQTMIRKKFGKRYYKLLKDQNIKIQIKPLDKGRTEIHIHNSNI